MMGRKARIRSSERTVDQLKDNLASLALQLPPAALAKLEAVSANAPTFPRVFTVRFQR